MVTLRPFTVYQVRWLPPVHRQLGEGNEEFALRVQQLVAKELGQTGTRLTPADKAEHMKRQRHPRLRPQSARTGCVDLTITNLLEGAVAFMPEDITEGTQSLPTASAPKFPSSGPVTPQPTALTFAKSSGPGRRAYRSESRHSMNMQEGDSERDRPRRLTEHRMAPRAAGRRLGAALTPLTTGWKGGW